MSPNAAIAKVYIGTRSYLVKELNASNYLQWCNTMRAILKSEDLLPYLQDPEKKDSCYAEPDAETSPAVTPKSIEKMTMPLSQPFFLQLQKNSENSLTWTKRPTKLGKTWRTIFLVKAATM
jgi:hypothetical protein